MAEILFELKLGILRSTLLQVNGGGGLGETDADDEGEFPPDIVNINISFESYATGKMYEIGKSLGSCLVSSLLIVIPSVTHYIVNQCNLSLLVLSLSLSLSDVCVCMCV